MEPVARRTPKKLKPSAVGQQRRLDLQEAAIRCISEKGYTAVTTTMVCHDGGFSRGLIGHYFKGMDELMIGAVRQSIARLQEQTRLAMEVTHRDPAESLHAVVRSCFSPPGFSPHQAAVWVAVAGNAKWSPALGMIYRQLWLEYRTGLARLFAQAAAARCRPIDANGAALLLSRMIEGFWVAWAVQPTFEIAESQSACHTFVSLLLGEPVPAKPPQGH